MADILKGNYRLNNQPVSDNQKGKKAFDSLTDKLEESALAKLGGSICFVLKGNTFVWEGDDDEEAGS